MSNCPYCGGKEIDLDEYGTVTECEKCGTVYRMMGMRRSDSDEPTE